MKPIETPEGKLIRKLCEQIELARADIVAGKPNHALIELEYAQVVIEDVFTQHPEIRNCFYRPATVAIKLTV